MITWNGNFAPALLKLLWILYASVLVVDFGIEFFFQSCRFNLGLSLFNIWTPGREMNDTGEMGWVVSVFEILIEWSVWKRVYFISGIALRYNRVRSQLSAVAHTDSKPWYKSQEMQKTKAATFPLVNLWKPLFHYSWTNNISVLQNTWTAGRRLRQSMFYNNHILALSQHSALSRGRATVYEKVRDKEKMWIEWRKGSSRWSE